VNQTIKELIDERCRALVAAQELVDAALAEGRELTAEEEQNLQRAVADAELAQRRIAIEEQREALEAAAAAQHDAVPAEESAVPRYDLDVVVEALRAGQQPAGEIGGLPTVGQRYVLPWEQRADTPITSGTGGSPYGGYLVPTSLASYVEDIAYKTSAILGAGADVIVTRGINPVAIPKVTTAATFGVISEGAAAADSSQPVFAQTALGAYRVGGHTVVTSEMLASTEVDLAAFLQRSLGQALAQQVAAYLATGSGTNQPQGIFTGATSGKTSSVAGSFTYDDLVDLVASLGAQYWAGAVLIASQGALVQMLKLKDLDDRPLIQPAPTADMFGSFHGFPVKVDPQGPALSGGNKVIVLGQPQHYHVRIGMGGGVLYETSRDAQFASWNVVIRIAQYVDARIGDTNAFKALTIAS